MAMPVIQPSFAAGELSPGLFARVDLAKFHVGAAMLRNFFVDARGGASSRPGTQFIIPCLPGINRLIPFAFSVTQTYALLFSDLKLRFVTNGGALLEGAKNVTGASQANPCQLTVLAHGYATGDWVWVSGVGGMTRLNGRFFQITKTDNDHFTLQDTLGNNIDSTAFAAYTAGGTTARIYTIVSPYAQADLALLKFTQSADTMTLTHPSYQPRQLVRSGPTNWAFNAVAAVAAIGSPTAANVTPKVGAAGTTYRYVITAIDAAGRESAPSAAGSTAVAATMSTTAAENMTVGWTAPAGVVALYNVYRQIEVPGAAPDPNELFGYVGSSAGVAFVDRNITPDFTRTPPITFDPFAGNAWPGCTTYHQSRQIFAGANAQPQTLNASKTGDFLNFSYSSPSRANDGIVATISSRQVNAIKHVVPLQSLLVLTASGAWRVDGGSTTSAITPATIEAIPQAFNGCSDVPPIVVNYDVLYVQAKGSIVRDLAYNFYVNVYTGQDMTVLANHLFFGHQITEWAWAEEPFKIIWAVREDGVLLSFTFLKEQDVYGWAHHDGDGLFQSVTSVSEGTEDAVYFVVQRLVNGNLVSYVERLASRNMSAKPEYNPPIPADLSKAWFVDCGLRYPLTKPAATLTPAATGLSPATIPQLPPITYTIVGVDAIAPGNGYSANPAIVVTDDLGTGNGAQITANVVGGQIVGYNVVNAGQYYQKPVITITDPTGDGTAVAQAIVSNDVVMNSSAPHGALVGDMVRVNDGWGPVRLVNSATRITVNVQQPLSSIWPAASGAWSATTPVTTLSGLDHLEGKAVSVLADGNVVSDGVQNPINVQNGTVTLPQGASSIVIGLPYKAQLKSLYTDVPGQAPTVQGRRLSISAVTVRVQDTVGLKVGHTFRSDELVEMKDRDFQPMGQPVLPFTGDRRVVVGSRWEVDAQVCMEQSNPLPATVLGLIPELQVGDT